MAFKCKVCGFETDRRKTIRLHVKNVHKLELRELMKQNRDLKAEADRLKTKDTPDFLSIGILYEAKL
jgi:hypothetical protein